MPSILSYQGNIPDHYAITRAHNFLGDDPTQELRSYQPFRTIVEKWYGFNPDTVDLRFRGDSIFIWDGKTSPMELSTSDDPYMAAFAKAFSSGGPLPQKPTPEPAPTKAPSVIPEETSSPKAPLSSRTISPTVVESTDQNLQSLFAQISRERHKEMMAMIQNLNREAYSPLPALSSQRRGSNSSDSHLTATNLERHNQRHPSSERASRNSQWGEDEEKYPSPDPTDLQNELTQAHEWLTRANEEMGAKNEQIAQLEEQIQERNRAVQGLEVITDSLASRMREKEAELASLNESHLRETEGLLLQTRKCLAEIDEERRTKSEKIAQLEEQIQERNLTIQGLEREVNFLFSEIGEAETELASLRETHQKEMSEFENALDQSHKEKLDVERSYQHQLEASEAEHNEQIAQLEAQIQEQHRAVDTANLQMRALGAEVDSLYSEVERKQAEIETLEDMLGQSHQEKLDAEYSYQQQLQASQAEHNEKIAQLEGEIDDLTRALAQVNQEKGILESSFGAEREQLQKEITKLQTENAKTKETFRQLEKDSFEEIGKFRTELRNFDSALKKREAEKKALQERLTQVGIKNQELEGFLNASSQEKNHLHKVIASLKTKGTELEALKRNYASDAQLYAAALNEVAQLKQRDSKLQSDFTDKIEKLTAELEKSQTEANRLRKEQEEERRKHNAELDSARKFQPSFASPAQNKKHDPFAFLNSSPMSEQGYPTPSASSRHPIDAKLSFKSHQLQNSTAKRLATEFDEAAASPTGKPESSSSTANNIYRAKWEQMVTENERLSRELLAVKAKASAEALEQQKTIESQQALIAQQQIQIGSLAQEDNSYG